MKWSERITELCKIQYPLLQAPMAGGASTPALIAAVANAGGLGAIPAGYLSVSELAVQIASVKALTSNPFQVNIFVNHDHTVDISSLYEAAERMSELFSDYGVEMPELNSDDWRLADNFAQAELLVEQQVPIVSFTFGIPDAAILEYLKANHIVIIGTATHLLEAILWEENGADAVILQGIEAGGHRATFIGNALKVAQSTHNLLQQISQQLSIPVIAAGGIMSAKAMRAALTLGADAVCLGTALLATEESGIPEHYKLRLLSANELDNYLTKQWSGRWARGIVNAGWQSLESLPGEPAPFPIQHYLTNTLRRQAQLRGDEEYMALWASANSYLCQQVSAAELIQNWFKDTQIHSR